MSAEESESERDLARVREELRRRGYLSHGFKQFLLQDAQKPRRPLRALLVLAGKVGSRTGLALALALSFWLAAANGALGGSPFDLAVLFLHLFLPLALAASLAFLAAGALLVLVLRLYHVRRIEALTFAAASAAGVATVALALVLGQELILSSRSWQLAALACAAPLVLYALVRTVHNGLLALAIRLADESSEGSEGWLPSRAWLGFALVVAALLIALPTLLSAGRPVAEAPGSLPTVPGGRVLLIGIDGVLGSELDYLLARGELPELGRLAGSGAVLSYARGTEVPASFWTTIATGRPTPEHGVAALDGFRPLGARTTLMKSGPLRSYWSGVEVPLGLAEHRPILSGRRSAFAVWELAARGGDPVLAVDWWATFPAEPLPGLIVAHGAYGLLGDRAQGAVAPPGEAPQLARLATSSAREEAPAALRALPAAERARFDARALAPDRFYRRVFLGALALVPKTAALYLAGLDVAAVDWRGGDLAFADLLRAELQATDRLIGEARPGFDTVAVVIDPGRRGRPEGRDGRVVLWRTAGCGGRARILPGAVASGLLRALGLPQSAELPDPPGACRWTPAPSRIATYGSPAPKSAPARESGEYLENLRSLGYL